MNKLTTFFKQDQSKDINKGHRIGLVMTQKINQKELDEMIERLNELSGLKVLAQGRYGYIGLDYKEVDKAGMTGISTFRSGLTKSQAYEMVYFAVQILEEMEQMKQKQAEAKGEVV